jgi:transposase-like protein
MPTSSSALSICSAMPKLISLRPIAPSFNNAGVRSNHRGTLKWAIASSKNFAIRFAKAYPTWIGELRKKREHYLTFLKYPESMRRSFSTTNVVEAINGQLEIMRRNSGGYFHSEETLKFKLGLAISSLEDSRWRTVARSFASAIPQLNALFQSRFEETR